MVSYDFSGLYSVLWAIVPLIIIVSLIAYFRDAFGRSLTSEPILTKRHQAPKRLLIFVIIVGSVMIIGGCMVAQPVKGAVGAISPDSGSFMLGLPITFNLSSLNTSTSYTWYLDGVAQTPTMTSASDGTATLMWTPNTKGAHVLTFKQGAVGTVIATASIVVQDLVNDLIIPIMTLMLVITVIMGVFGKIKGWF